MLRRRADEQRRGGHDDFDDHYGQSSCDSRWRSSVRRAVSVGVVGECEPVAVGLERVLAFDYDDGCSDFHHDDFLYDHDDGLPSVLYGGRHVDDLVNDDHHVLHHDHDSCSVLVHSADILRAG